MWQKITFNHIYLNSEDLRSDRKSLDSNPHVIPKTLKIELTLICALQNMKIKGKENVLTQYIHNAHLIPFTFEFKDIVPYLEHLSTRSYNLTK